MNPVTAEEVQAAVKAANITVIPHHDCACCGAWVKYEVVDGELFFDSSCDCGWSEPQPRSFQDAADWINMQTNEDARSRIKKAFGFP